MFKKRVIDWNLNKNYKAAEREAVARVVEQYRNHGDPIPPILLRGQPVKMHRIQRHCKIGQSVTGLFASAGPFDSSVLENDHGQIQPGGSTAEYNKKMYPMDDMRITADNRQNMTAALFAIPLRQLSPPDELKHAEVIAFQTNIYYEWITQPWVASEMKGCIRESQGELNARMATSPGAFRRKVSSALSSLKSSQSTAGWRLLDEAMDMIKPMLASKNLFNFEAVLRVAWEWEILLPSDIYRMILGQILEMAPIVLGESDPLSKVCLAIAHIRSKNHVYEIAARLMRSIFERTLGPCDSVTVQAKSKHVESLLAIGDFNGAECLQRRVISDYEELGNKKEVAEQVFYLSCILERKRGFIGTKMAFRDALHLGRGSSWREFSKAG
jgi:hypothetical protein